jgi:hypothetical protein
MSRNVTQTHCKLAIDVPNSKTLPQNPIGKYIAKLIAHSLIVDLPKGDASNPLDKTSSPCTYLVIPLIP